MDTSTGQIIQLFSTQSIFRVVVDYFLSAQVALAEGNIKEDDIFSGFLEKFALEEICNQIRVERESVNWEKVFDEMKELNSPSYPSKFILRGKLEDRGINPDSFNFAGWDLTIAPNEEEEWNKRYGFD